MPIIKTFLIVGNRRWARILIEELCFKLKDNTQVCLIGNPQNKELKKWLYSAALSSKVKIFKTIKPLDIKNSGVAFVANSAYLHKSCIKDLLNKGYHVISEKPVTFSKIETVKLINFAAKKKLQLLCTNTYSFASYLKKLKNDYLKKNKYSDIYITWADPKREIRYKQSKMYDSSVPIIYDILPHVANILYATIGNFKLKLNSLDVKNGGSKVSIHYKKKNLNLFVTLERNAIKRKRFIKFISTKNQYSFNFTYEPGLISINDHNPFKLDPKWSIRPKPISTMINSVINFFELKKKDTRLSLLTSLLGNELIDAVAKDYITNQIQFISNHRKNKKNYNSKKTDIAYALKELESVKNRTVNHVCKNSPLLKLISSVSGQQIIK